MTEAEQKLLDACVEMHAKARATDSDVWGPLVPLVDAVLAERLPPEYEQTLRDLSFRSWDAMEASIDYAKKHPLGGRLRSDMHGEWCKARGR